MVEPALSPFEILMPEFLADPYPGYARLRESTPVWRNPALQGWVLTRYDDCALVFRDHDMFSSDIHHATSALAKLRMQQADQIGLGVDTVLSRDPPVHTRLRAIVNKAFTPARVERMRAHIEKLTEELLKARGCETFDVVSELAEPLPIVVIAEMLGVPASDRETFRRWSKEIAAGTDPMVSQEVIDRVGSNMGELREYIGGYLDARRAEPHDDLLSALVHAEEDGASLSEAELLAFIILLLAAGNVTTTSLIGNGVLALARNPSEASLLREDPSLIPSAIEELVRYDPPVQVLPRVAQRETEIRGERIAEGDSLFVVIGAANRDPEIFPDPDRLDVRRSGNKHLGFGLGIHYCLGAGLARLEAEVALAVLLRRFESFDLVEEPVYSGTFVLRGLEALTLRCAPAAR
jgi:cytochrome P450